MRNKATKIVSVLLATSLIALSFTGCGKNKKVSENQIIRAELGQSDYVQQEYTTIASNVRKQETVYVNLAPDGTTTKVNVTDWIHTDAPQVRVQDTSDLTEIHNVKSLTEPVIKDGLLCWDMDTTDLYYAGVSDKTPPVSFDIKYTLDGNEISYTDIAGKSGKVSMTINVTNNLKKSIGNNQEVSCPMLLVGGMLLNEDIFSNIDINNGTIVGDGTKQIVFFVGVPGMDESLKLSANNVSLLNPDMLKDSYTVTADANNFAVGNMMFAALPISSIGSLGNGGLPETVDDIKGVLTDVQKVESAVKGLDLNGLVSLLYGDANKITDMMNAVNEAVALYKDNEKLIKTFGGYMTDENIAAIDKLLQDLSTTDMEQVLSTINDPQLRQLMSLLPSLSKSLSSVSALSEDLEAIMPMMQALSKDMDDPEIQASMQNLPDTLNKLKELLGVLEENKALLDKLEELANSDTEQQVNTIMDTAKKYINMNDLSQAQIDDLATRMREWLSFGQTYTIFTTKTDNTQSSVLFTYKTDAVKAPSQSTTAETATEAKKKDS